MHTLKEIGYLDDNILAPSRFLNAYVKWSCTMHKRLQLHKRL